MKIKLFMNERYEKMIKYMKNRIEICLKINWNSRRNQWNYCCLLDFYLQRNKINS